ncbi:MFS transporter [Pseudomonas sp. FSL R10-0056]|uniref:MFS transporter n=1 Tax=unclassified Pseudomonas TaxID=196821 RepID=UPI001294A363|nr:MULTISPECIES: MFS transporter [unclassified Pseudomonas]MDN5392412.1 MFS transporter [Pseudomonas sp.]MDN5394080.1 MFS transporter [Pseudomonas sp.]MDN5408659.1 MFS transporter [Pseudomonas sp.]MDN5454941.1 MFS transporter [Pseudomonas sp.]MDN5459751.1 MFS transporter [Pseudomonas sp.]
MTNPALQQALSKIRWRILPFVALMFAMAIIDRSNIGFAKHALQADTGLSNAAFALGAGIFFIGYAVFEVPSNLMLHKIGARIWLSRIMVTWGLVSAAMMFAHDETSFYILRFLLGVAEAGLSPGVVLYLTYWFPQNQRGSAYGIYYFGVPVSLMVGGPVSGWLLESAQFGLTGWQWMFVTEGLAASIIGVFAFFYLTDKPRDAKWLNTEEKAAIEHELEKEQLQKANKGPSSWRAAMFNSVVLYFTLIYFTIQVSVYGVLFYLPTRIAELLGTGIGLKVGALTSIPWIATVCMLYLVTRHADRKGQQTRYAALMLAMAAVGMIGSTLSGNLVLVIMAFCVAAAGFITVQPLFWTLPTRFLGGAAAASGIAVIGALGNLGGFLAPTVKTWAEGYFNNPHAGMYFLAGTALLGALMLIRSARASGNPGKLPAPAATPH